MFRESWIVTPCDEKIAIIESLNAALCLRRDVLWVIELFQQSHSLGAVVELNNHSSRAILLAVLTTWSTRENMIVKKADLTHIPIDISWVVLVSEVGGISPAQIPELILLTPKHPKRIAALGINESNH